MSKYEHLGFVDSKKFSWVNLYRAILYLFGDKKTKYLWWLSALAVILIFSIIPPLLLGKVVDFFSKYTPGQSLAVFYWYVALLGVITAVTAFFRLSIKRILSELRNDITYDIRVNGLEKLLSQNLLNHGQENTGEKEMKIQNGIAAFKSLALILENRLLPSISSTFGIAMVLIFLKPIFIGLFLIYIAIFFSIIKFYNARLFELNDECNRAMERSSGSYIEGLSNIMTIKSTGSEKHFKQTIASKEELRKKFDKLIIHTTNNQWKFFQIVNSVFMAIFLLCVGLGVSANQITVGSIVILFTYLQKVISNSSDVLGSYSEVVSIKATISRMMLIFWSKKDIHDGHKKFPSWDLIKLSSANFQYTKNNDGKNFPATINNLNLIIRKNQKVGIIGTTGSGKSTLAKLLIGLYQIDGGSFTIGKLNFYKIKRDEIFKHCAIVLQESEMFNVSLRENIALNGKFNQVLFDQAVSIAHLDEVIKKLPEGVETLIGERGYHLSGGERQRIGIARAIYKNPEIIIFDEATSSLDVMTEKKIQTALAKELTQKTIIIVAHRTNTLEDVDIIYKIEKGMIVASGTYAEFFENKINKN